MRHLPIALRNDGTIDDVEASRETGYRYPDGGNTTRESFDVCGDCFEKKLKSWMASFGASPSATESDY